VARAELKRRKSEKGYLRRKADRGWFYGTFQFAHQHPEIFRIAFENTLLNLPGQLDFLDLLGQYYFANSAPQTDHPILMDEGLLHRGSAIFLYSNAFSDLQTYLDALPPCPVIVHIQIDIATAIDRCGQRPKGLPLLYKQFSRQELTEAYQRLSVLHQTCLDHQRAAGATVITIDGTRPIAEAAQCVLDHLNAIAKPGKIT
jgi:hypothetical protein